MDVYAAIQKSGLALGYAELKDKQVEAMTSFLKGKDTFVSLPTGYGKSLIYAALPLAFDYLKGRTTPHSAFLYMLLFIAIRVCTLGRKGSIVICISPLTSLMMDQQAKYSHLGLTTEFVGEAQLDKGVKEKIINGEVQLVYITPESTIETSKYQDMLLSPAYQDKLVALVIDEAHCVKTWGDQFRTTFAKIGNLHSLIPKEVNILALTATATTETYHVVTQRLAMNDASLVALPPNRDNIVYEIHPKIDVDHLTTFLGNELLVKRLLFPKTVIYVRSYSDCSGIYMRLKRIMGSAFTEPVGSPNLTGF